MTLIRIDPIGVRNAGLAAVQAADGLQDQAGQLRTLELPPMPAAMTAKYQAGLEAVAGLLVDASGTLGPAGVEMQVRAAAAETTDGEGGVRGVGAGNALAKAIQTTVVLPGGKTGLAQITPTRGGQVSTGTVGSIGLKLTLADAIKVAPTAAPDPTTAGPGKGAGPTDPGAGSSDTGSGRAQDRTPTQPVAAGEAVGGRPAAAVQQAVAGDGSAGGGGGGTALSAAAADPSSATEGQHRATADAEPPKVPGDDATRQDWACWMAKSAMAEGVPPTLPVMAALVRSDLQAEGGDHASGFFGFDPATTKAPAGHGSAGATQPADWWRSNPEAQLDLFLKRALRMTADGDASTSDPGALGQWAAATTPDGDATAMTGAAINAQELVDECGSLVPVAAASAGGGAGGAGGSALEVASSQLGVKEVGTNAGTEVNAYLASAGVGSGNPWCASFVHWSLAQSGTELPGGGWAAVSNWVGAAQNGDFGLQLVDAADARPGDIVAYDWGGGTDFGSDGHIGFLESSVQGGQFTTVEGNAQDAVTRMQRSMDSGSVVFIRAGAGAVGAAA